MSHSSTRGVLIGVGTGVTPGEILMHRVLIVDDEHVVAETLRLIFEKHGFAACTAHSADEAMRTAETFHPDLMLCDLSMPVKDGVELISEMDGKHPACPILVLTGAYSCIARARERAGKLRKRLAILSKPCPPAEVLREADALLGMA